MSEDDDNRQGEEPQGEPEKKPESPKETEYFPGERGRRVPRGAWWVLAVACVVLLAFIVVRPNWFTHGPNDTGFDVPANRLYSKTLPALGDGDGIYLNDDSPSASFTTTLPVDSTLQAVRLRMRGTTQVGADSTAFLSVVVNGKQVYKSELPHGDNDFDASANIPPTLPTNGTLHVLVRVDGTLNNQRCVSDHTSGANVHLDTDTVLEAALGHPVHTVRDTVASWDHEVTMFVADTSDPWRTAAAQLGIALTRAGHHVTFVDRLPDKISPSTVLVGPLPTLGNATDWTPESESAAQPLMVGTVGDTSILALTQPNGGVAGQFLTGPALATADADHSNPQTLPTEPAAGDQASLASLGADTSVVSIGDSHNWRAGYSLADFPGGRMPRALSVAFALPAAPSDLTWIMNVTLNGTLVSSQRLTGTTNPVVVPLPAADQRLDNSLTIGVQRDRDAGGCDVRVTNYSMQLQDSSALLLGDDPGSGFTALPRSLAGGFDVYVPAAPPASTIGQLNSMVPVLAAFVPATQTPDFRWNAQPVPGQPFALVGDNPQVQTVARIDGDALVAGSGASATRLSAFDTGLIVETATDGGSNGLVIQSRGAAGSLPLPDFGRESAQVVTAGGATALGPDGRQFTPTQARAGAPG